MALTEVRGAIATRDIERLGRVSERDALAMHAVMMTSTPSLLYWQGGTVEVMQAARRWREEEGIPVFFTIDAGPNVHLICEENHRSRGDRTTQPTPRGRTDPDQQTWSRASVDGFSSMLMFTILHPGSGYQQHLPLCLARFHVLLSRSGVAEQKRPIDTHVEFTSCVPAEKIVGACQ